jgi:hypothetical protein
VFNTLISNLLCPEPPSAAPGEELACTGTQEGASSCAFSCHDVYALDVSVLYALPGTTVALILAYPESDEEEERKVGFENVCVCVCVCVCRCCMCVCCVPRSL